MQDFWQSSYRWPVIIVVIVVFLIGLFMGRPSSGGHVHHEQQEPVSTKTQTWTCSMHPQIKQPKPGKCPICFMDLVPVQSGGDDKTSRRLTLTPMAVKLAAIRTAPVERRFVAADIRMVGKVAHDESRMRIITAWIPGRLDRLYVDYTGVSVREGDHLVNLYSPELITAQQELLQALKTYKKFASGKSLVDAAREKLKLWGLTPKQIREIESQAKPSDHLTIYSPISGVVVGKNAVQGMYVNTGTKIYTIADLSQVWVKLDAYESDLSWIRYGQTVEFETETFPGEVFTGRIAFIDPEVNPTTRTVKVRVNVSNPHQKLKPEMFVHAVVHSKLSASGKVLVPELAGKWISPMHPEIIKDRPGTCDVCGMPLVKAEELGYITAADQEQEAPLVIPASAPLITGTRAVVYVTVPGKEGMFEGKEIVLGPRAGDYYLVKEGLKEGENVVVNGAFKIDSDLQIQAKPSMMSPEDGTVPGHHQTIAGDRENHEAPAIPTAFRDSIDALAEAYFDVHHALSSDSLTDAQKGTKKLLDKLAKVDMTLFSGSAHMEWMKEKKKIETSSRSIAQAKDIEAARTQFEILTGSLTTVIKTFATGKMEIYRFHCPMAFNNKGAYWLQKNKDTRNPYFGASMLICKDSVEPLMPEKKEN